MAMVEPKADPKDSDLPGGEICATSTHCAKLPPTSYTNTVPVPARHIPSPLGAPTKMNLPDRSIANVEPKLSRPCEFELTIFTAELNKPLSA
mmetsp:Transcript_1711/g.6791  ORF Transcript_1711/g.6791 Transcript_1711/m.6791 type:complete len:92 (+) Transcript_1711:1310-1585(+)